MYLFAGSGADNSAIYILIRCIPKLSCHRKEIGIEIWMLEYKQIA
jgi:hypothetical protein